MTLSATKGSMFIVQGLLPYLIMILQLYELWQGFCNVHVYEYSCVGGIPSYPGWIHHFHKDPNRISYTFQYL